ncbi:MAG: phage tail tape measure protein, partial [Desulfobacterales bacterium]|nr:phage tail tape measure protein [Desulfobacterales bacterium]
MEAATTKSTNSISQRFKAMAPGIQKIGKTMTIAGGVITGALAACLYKAVAVGDELDKMSKRTGVAVEELSALKYAAEISGTELGTVENSLRFLARAMDDTSKGTGEAKDAFEKLGISVTDIQGNLRPTVEVMKEAATKIAGMTNETEKVSAATDIFGSRYGTELLPLLKEGGEGIEDLMNKAKNLGLVISTEAATKAAEFNDRMTEMKSSLGALSLKIGDVLIPAIKPLVEEITKIIGKMSKWTQEHPQLTKLLSKFALVIGGLMVAGGPLLMLAPTIAGIATALPGLIAAFGPLLGPLGIIMAIATAVGLLYKAWTEDWGGIQKKTRTVINTITGAFTKFANFVTQNILNPIIEGFESFANSILGTIGDMVGGIIDLFGKLPDFMLKVFKTSKEEVGAFAEDIREKLSLELGRIPKIAEDAFKWQEPVIEKTKEMGKEMEGFGKITEPVLDKAKEGMKGFGEATKGTAEELAKLKERMDKLRAGAESMGLEQEKMQKLIAQTAMTATEKVEDLRKQLGLTRESIADVFAATGAREAAAEAGTEAGEAFAYGKSPGGFLPTIEEAIREHL